MNIVMKYELRPFLLAFIFLIPAALAQDIDCLNNGNYTANSPYHANLNSTLSFLYTNIDSSGFSNASAGDAGPDRASAAVLCRGDLQLDECRDCVRNASAELLRTCPNQKQAIRTFDEFCMLRYSNDTIYRVLTTQPWHGYIARDNVTSPDLFMVALRSLVDEIRDRAASGGSLRKVAAGSTTGPDFQSIYAMVHCTPDLSPNDCTNCLIVAATELPSYSYGRRGARIFMPSCMLRYEVLCFYNETRLRELERVSVATPPSQPLPGKGDGNTARTTIILVVSVVSGMVLAVFAFILLRRRRKRRLIEETDHENEDAGEKISTAESLQYAFSTIKAATNNFSESNKLGQGGFGTVYKGELANGNEIAVKRLAQNSIQGDLEFKNEVLLLVKLQHRNLVRLMGFVLEGKEKLLIYEFVENASLDHFIFGSKNSYLDWDRRYKIIVGIARGILYLHEDSRLRIVHRDLKAGNILLDGDMNPKIADFGMARLFMQDETQGNTSRIVGTFGYMPPEYLMQGQFSAKSDVFSFGVLLLEIISGQKNNNFQSGEKVGDLLSIAWENLRAGNAASVVDPMLRSGSGSIRDMVRCIHISLLCVQENAADRPTMASVVLMLNSSSMTLAVPSEPAFYFRSGFTRIQEDNSGDVVSNSSSKQGDHLSQYDVSNTELYPR